MGVGILPDKVMEMPPGTVLFSDDPNAAARAAYEGIDLGLLKHGKGKDEHIILVPQPSDDPNDPLNWSRMRKALFYATTFYGTVIVGVAGPLVSADQPNIAADFGTDTQGISRILGSWLTFTLAVSTVIMQPIAAKIGKRPIYLFTTVLLIVAAVGSSYCHTIGPYAATRVIGAVGMAPLEFLVGSSIADIYCLHERGVPIAAWNFALLAGINLTSPIAGQILADPNWGWRWCYRFYAIACVPLLIAQFLWMPETTYKRRALLPPTDHHMEEKDKADTDLVEAQPSPSHSYPPKKTFMQELKPWSQIYPTRNSIWFMMAQPFILLFTPGILWGGIDRAGLGITWLVLLATSFALLFSDAPYNFNASQSGLIYLSPFVGSLIAFAISGPITDWLARVLSKRQGGIYDPEMKLPPVALYAILGGGGLFGFGWTLQTRQPWPAPVICFGAVQAGLVFGTSAVVSYIVDLHRNQSDAAVAALIFWKNMWSFILTWSIVDWILAMGVGPTMSWCGGVTIFGCALTPLIYVFGRRLRSFVFRHIKFEGEGTAAH